MKKTVPLATLAILAALSLAACSPGDPTDPDNTDSTPTATSTSTSEETPGADDADGDGGGLDPDVLFTISATATAPNGAIATLVQTVYKPVTTTNQQSVDEAALDGECTGWRDTFPSAEYVISLIDVTDQSPAGASWDRSVAVASMNGWPVFTGEVDTFQAYCASYQVNLGASRAVTPITAGSGAEGPHGWAHIEYGFGIATDPSLPAPGPDDTLLSNCQVTLSAEAAASPIASAWVWNGDPLDCLFGEYDFGV
jgi:hypothetical protein